MRVFGMLFFSSLIITFVFACGSAELIQTASYGGLKGGSFKESKEFPLVLVGFDARCGRFVDSITPIYREVNSDGTMGEGKIWGKQHGGNGGGRKLLEKDGYVVAGLKLRTGSYVDRIIVIFKKWTENGVSENTVTQSITCGDDGGSEKEIMLRPGEVAVGIYGRSAQYLNRIGLIAIKY